MLWLVHDQQGSKPVLGRIMDTRYLSNSLGSVRNPTVLFIFNDIGPQISQVKRKKINKLLVIRI